MTTRAALLSVVAAVLTGCAPAPREESAASRQLAEEFKGTWQLTSRIEDGVESDTELVENRRMVVGDGKYTLYDGKEEFRTARFKVDATKNPHHFDLPEQDFNQFGVIKLEGDMLTICLGPADGPRATEFESPKGKDWVLVTYKRVK